MNVDLPAADGARPTKRARPLCSAGVVLGIAAAIITPVAVIGMWPGTTVQARGLMGVLWAVYAVTLLGVVLRRVRSWPIVAATTVVAIAVIALGVGALGQALGGVDEVARWYYIAVAALVLGIVGVLALAAWPRRA